MNNSDNFEEKLNFNNAKTTIIKQTKENEKEKEVLLLKLKPVKFEDLKIIKNEENEYIDDKSDELNKSITSNNKKIFHNDKVKKYTGKVITEYELTQIYPANKKDIYKFSFCPRFSTLETWNKYNTIIRQIALQQNIDWIYNILNHESETENILYEDDDILFIYDCKCNKQDLNSFYALVFFKNERILSLRDLEQRHIPLLNYTKNKISDFMNNKFNIEKNKLRMYFHYPPSFWYLHIHVNLFDSFQDGILVDYCYMLHNVISNLTINNDYYKLIDMEIMNR